LIHIHQGVTHYALFRHLILRFVLLEGGFDLAFVRRDFGFQFLGFDERVVQLHLFILDAKLILQFGGTDADAVGDELAEFLFEQAPTD